MKNAQNLLQTVLRGVHAAETACIIVNLAAQTYTDKTVMSTSVIQPTLFMRCPVTRTMSWKKLYSSSVIPGVEAA